MSKTTIDHDEIRKWAESKGGKPAAVARTHDDKSVGIIRLMFPKSPQSEHGELEEIGWDEFFEQFEDGELALIYDEKTLFNKIVGRDTVEKREHGEHASRHHPAHEHDGGTQHKQAASGKGESHAKSETKAASHAKEDEPKHAEHKAEAKHESHKADAKHDSHGKSSSSGKHAAEKK